MIGRASPKDLEPALDAMTKHLDDFDIDELIDAKEANERFLIRAARLKIKRGANHGAVGELVEAPYQGWTTAYKIRPKKN